MLKVNEYGGRQAKGNEKRQCFKGWETLVKNIIKNQTKQEKNENNSWIRLGNQ